MGEENNVSESTPTKLVSLDNLSTYHDLMDAKKEEHSIELTKAQYDALTPAEKMNGKTYFVSGTGGMDVIIKNGVTYGGSMDQVQANYTENDSTSPAYIKNKPTLGTASAKDSTTTIASGNIDLPTSEAVYTALQNVHVDVDTEIDSTSNNPIANSAVADALDEKVDKESGKGLSTNDFTTTYKDKLDGIASGAEVNVQTDWSEADSTSDAYLLNKPTSLSAFTNDQGFINNTVNNLTNYYTKNESYSKTEVDTMISAAKSGRFIYVATLPTTDIHTDAIYLVPKTVSQTDNVKDEYINLDGTSEGWEKIGDTEIDLSNYVQKSQTAGLIKNDGTIDTTSYATSASVSAITDGQSIDSFSDVETALSSKADNTTLNNYIQKSQTSGLVKNDGTIDTNTYVQISDLPSAATSSTLGLVKPDNSTITVDANGVISASADLSNYIEKSNIEGLVKNDGTIDTNSYSIMTKTRYTVTASNWSTTADASGYYTYALSLTTELASSYPPNVYSTGASDSVFATDAEKEAYALVDECSLISANNLTFYAKTKPTTTFYVSVEGLKDTSIS